MVGTFISKYLLVITSTITVTSSAAVTFFVAKHLKVGRNYWMAMDYVKEQYLIAIKNKLEFENDEARIVANIEKILSDLHKCKSLKKENCEQHIKLFHDFLDEFKKKQGDRRMSDNFQIVERLANILGDNIPDTYDLETVRSFYFPNDKVTN